MTLCSLEDEEYGNMFITQEAKNIVPLVPNFDVESDMELSQDKLKLAIWVNLTTLIFLMQRISVCLHHRQFQNPCK